MVADFIAIVTILVRRGLAEIRLTRPGCLIQTPGRGPFNVARVGELAIDCVYYHRDRERSTGRATPPLQPQSADAERWARALAVCLHLHHYVPQYRHPR